MSPSAVRDTPQGYRGRSSITCLAAIGNQPGLIFTLLLIYKEISQCAILNMFSGSSGFIVENLRNIKRAKQ